MDQKEYERTSRIYEVISAALSKFKYSDYSEFIKSQNLIPMSEEKFDRAKSDVAAGIFASTNKLVVDALKDAVAQEEWKPTVYSWGADKN